MASRQRCIGVASSLTLALVARQQQQAKNRRGDENRSAHSGKRAVRRRQRAAQKNAVLAAPRMSIGAWRRIKT